MHNQFKNPNYITKNNKIILFYFGLFSQFIEPTMHSYLYNSKQINVLMIGQYVLITYTLKGFFYLIWQQTRKFLLVHYHETNLINILLKFLYFPTRHYFLLTNKLNIKWDYNKKTYWYYKLMWLNSILTYPIQLLYILFNGSSWGMYKP